MILIIFFSILFHELCHAIVSKIFNRKISKITILPFGTIFEVDSNDNINLLEELLIVLAGPLGSLFLMMFDDLYSINRIILIFNLLPIYPLDGGKIIETLLCKVFNFKLVLKIIYVNSIIFSFSMIIIGVVYSSINFVIIGVALLIINLKNIDELEIRYWNFLSDKLITKRMLPLKLVKTNNQNNFYRGYNNLFISKKGLLNEVDIIKINKYT
ncbi:hypothetical protein RJG79_06185 [Mycoplasmatota bacterium WC44]